MPDIKCRKCGKLFFTEAQERIESPLCVGCIRKYNSWAYTYNGNIKEERELFEYWLESTSKKK